MDLVVGKMESKIVPSVKHTGPQGTFLFNRPPLTYEDFNFYSTLTRHKSVTVSFKVIRTMDIRTDPCSHLWAPAARRSSLTAHLSASVH
uniref:UBC core domain-containing protein n=1 Tax=Steinernema glaseri TaxID=37863 RepID=A0A1I8ANN4_9BILA